ncbi:hypothetical protein K435DRAFT_691228 [Dendrothele bispora CBS 962.96]|uniref:Uncharacterized protein n=2 Tax=Dendrothele bispora (strain CBS 962.96) TaxID=1314807 RepID=A0A4S8L2H4_DENBC|nr:hypothetical protein K435DRAFT_691228 [Dendrothele bispora CBS 962.96]
MSEPVTAGKVKTSIPGLEISEAALKATQNDKLPQAKKRAPTFDKEEPENLERYIAELEDIFEANNVEPEESKIYMALKYMEYRTRLYHVPDAKEAAGSWEAFKKLLRKAYPESVGDERGSLIRLIEIVSKHSPIVLGQRERLLKYIREFTIECNKLTAQPVMISNQQAVALFLRALDVSIRNAMVPYLPAISEDTRPEDPYTLTTVVEAAKKRGKKIIIVGKPSDDLRVTYPIINGSNQMVECIMDNGSQIVSMDTRVASGLHLSWDPDVVIHMQSANGNLNKTKGLARNVPFKFGDLVVYLQVHVIDNCPYELLVGRPFDVLCETTVQNTQTGDQFITIHDPNSDRRCTIPTYARGQKPEILPPPENKLVPMGPIDGPPPSTGPVEHEEPGKNENVENEAQKESTNFQRSLMNCLIDRER